MRDDLTPATGFDSTFQPGRGVAVIGPASVLFIPEPDTAVSLQPLVDLVVTTRENVAVSAAKVLLTSGDDTWPSFALVEFSEVTTFAYVRGPISVTVETEEARQEFDGSSYRTWLEQHISSPVRSITIGGAPSSDFYRVPAGGVVPAVSLRCVPLGALSSPELLDRVSTPVDAWFTPTTAPAAAAGSDRRPEEKLEPEPAFAPPPASEEPATPEEPEVVGWLAPALAPAAGTIPSIDQLFGGAAEMPVAATSEPEDPSGEVPVDPGNGTTSGDYLAKVRAAVTGSPLAPPTTGSTVRGRMCPQGHFNPALEARCLSCHEPIDLDSSIATGPRPRLGSLELDDGTMVFLDRPVILGRTPPGSEVIDGEVAQPLALDDDTRKISGIHLVVRFQGWEVTIEDRDSRNGTWITPPGQPKSKVRAGLPMPIPPGTVVDLAGRRTFTFHAG